MWNTDPDLGSLARSDHARWEQELVRRQRMGFFGPARRTGAASGLGTPTPGEPSRVREAADRADAPGPEARAGGTLERPSLLAALGLAAGYCSGFLGIGGGLVIVPILILAWRFSMRRAVGTSLVTIAGVSLAGVGAELVVKQSNIHWAMALVVTIASLAGSWAGGRLLARLPETGLRIAFALLALFAAYRMVAGGAAGSASGPLTLESAGAAGYLLGFLVGGLAGLTSVLFGLGGGLVMVPAFTLLFGDFPFHAARATSLVQIIPTAGLGAYQHYRLGTVDGPVARRLIPAGLAGAILGVVSVNLLPVQPCRAAFGVFLLFAAARLLRGRRRARSRWAGAAAVRRAAPSAVG
jgi:uncharacterized membrane protein YfcA